MQLERIFRGLELASDAYRDCPGRENVTVLDSENTGVQCYIRRRPMGRLDITFRGSNEKKDWQSNLRFRKMTVPYGNHRSPIRVHSGFLAAYKDETVRNVIHQEITPDVRSVSLSGHSYGAALSVLCAVDLEYHYPQLEYEVFLFGAPRIGNKAFVRSYNKRLYNTIRVENGNDMVTKLPCAWMGFRHVGAKLSIGAPRIFGVYSFSRHQRTNYYKALLKKLL